MENIQIKVLNAPVVEDSEKMMVAMARLTQRAHTINNMSDFESLLERSYTDEFVKTLCDLPHPTLQKFGVINIAIVGASRRFLAQITRHQNEVKFMSGSLQYSDYSDQAQFTVPYEITVADAKSNSAVCCVTDDWHKKKYIAACEYAMNEYKELAATVGNDAAGYAAPQGLRNVLLISATPFQWKHMISQRTCHRNTLETQYVMLRVWEELYRLSPMFADCGPTCIYGDCLEGKMRCGDPIINCTPQKILDEQFSLIRGKE